MELADRILESAEDMTAADTAPRPIKETAVGVRYWSTMGRTSDFLNSAVWLVALPDGSKKSVLVQSRVTLHKIQEFLSVMYFVAFKRPTTLIIASSYAWFRYTCLISLMKYFKFAWETNSFKTLPTLFFFFVLEDNTKKSKSIDFCRKNHMHIKAKKSWKMMEFLFLEYGI